MTYPNSVRAVLAAVVLSVGCAASGDGDVDVSMSSGTSGPVDTGGSGGALPVDKTSASAGSGSMSNGASSGSGSMSSGASSSSSASAASSSSASGGGNGQLCNKVTILNSNKACSECLEQNCCKVIHACIDEDLLGCVSCLDCFFEGKGAACCNESIGKNAWVEECVDFNCVKECG